MVFPLLAAPLLGGGASFMSAAGAAAAASTLGGGAAAAAGGGLGLSLFSSALPGPMGCGSGALAAREAEFKEEQRYQAQMQTYLNGVGRQRAKDQLARWTASRAASRSPIIKTQKDRSSHSHRCQPSSNQEAHRSWVSLQ